MNTIRDLYDLILEEYGKRGCWISEYADKAWNFNKKC